MVARVFLREKGDDDDERKAITDLYFSKISTASFTMMFIFFSFPRNREEMAEVFAVVAARGPSGPRRESRLITDLAKIT